MPFSFCRRAAGGRTDRSACVRRARSPASRARRIRIAEQFGVVYLMLNVARDQQLIEKEGRKAGLDIKVDWVRLSGGAAVNDALLSGAVDIAARASGRC